MPEGGDGDGALSINRDDGLRMSNWSANSFELANAFEQAAIPMCLVAPDGRFTATNKALEEFLGRTDEQLRSCTWQELTHPDDLAKDEQLAFEVVLGVRDSYRLRKRYLRPNGAIVWGDLTVTGIRTDGEFSHFVAQILDVTKFVGMQEDLRRSEHRTRLLLENSADVVFEATIDGSLEWVSPQVLETLGVEPAQFVGRSLAWLAFPDDLPALEAAAARLRDGAVARWYMRMKTAAGEYRWMSLHARPIMDEADVIIGHSGGWRDTDDAVRYRDHLSELTQRYELIASNTSDVILLLDDQARLKWASPTLRTVLGRTEEEIPEPLSMLVDPRDEGEIRRGIQSCQESAGKHVRVRARIRRTDGQLRWFDVSMTCVRAGDSRFDGAVISLRDIDDLVSIGDRSEAGEQRLRTLLDGMLEPWVLLQAFRDGSGRVVDFVFADANPAALAVYGLDRDQLVGQRLLVAHPAAATTDLFDRYVRVVETGDPMVLDDWSYPQDIAGGKVMRYDVRAVRAGDAVSQTWRDVTDRFESMQQLAKSEEQFRLLADNSTDVVVHLRGGRVSWISPSVEGAFGVPLTDWLGQSEEDLVHRADLQVVSDAFEVIQTGAAKVIRLRVRAPGREYHWVEAHARRYLDADGKNDGVIASIRLVDELVEAEAELQYRARYDELTGLANRAEAFVYLERALSTRRQGDRLAIMYCDVDNFKHVNDTFGHAGGDKVLLHLASQLDTSLRSGDFAARLGGDEFLIVLSGISAIDDAVAVAEKMRREASVPVLVDGTTVESTLSIGLAMVTQGESVDELLARADQALYRAKANGRDRVEVARG